MSSSRVKRLNGGRNLSEMVLLARNRALTYQLRVPNTLLNSCLHVYSAAKVTYLYNAPQTTVTAFHFFFNIILLCNVVLEENGVHMHRSCAKCSMTGTRGSNTNHPLM